MRIRNKRKFDFWLPYAGADNKGYKVKAGKLSPKLPSDRFYDPILQNDWKKDRIEVLLDDADIVVLGPDVANCVQVGTTHVTEDGQEVQPSEAEDKPAEKPAETAPAEPPAPVQPPTLEQLVEETQAAQIPAPIPPAHEPVTTEQLAEKMDAPPVQEEPAETPEPAQVTEQQGMPTATANAATQAPKAVDGDIHCLKCGRTAAVKMCEFENIMLCRYCRAASSKRRNQGLPPVQEPPTQVPAQSIAPEQAEMPPAQELPETAAPSGMDVPLPDPADKAPDPPKVPGIPHTPAPPQAPSLSDLQAANKRYNLGTPNIGEPGQPGVPTLQVGENNQPAKNANVQGITQFMGDMTSKGTPGK